VVTGAWQTVARETTKCARVLVIAPITRKGKKVSEKKECARVVSDLTMVLIVWKVERDTETKERARAVMMKLIALVELLRPAPLNRRQTF
jgi:hypothetical protein